LLCCSLTLVTGFKMTIVDLSGTLLLQNYQYRKLNINVSDVNETHISETHVSEVNETHISDVNETHISHFNEVVDDEFILDFDITGRDFNVDDEIMER